MFETIDIDTLLKLLMLRTKRELVVFSREAVVHSADFVALILATDAGAMPWTHLIHVRDYVPKHLALTDIDRVAIANAKPGPHTKETKKATNKIFQFFEERRYLVGHIFYNEELTDWHFFYFDQRDQDDEKHHWRGGPHIHFVNCLWPNLNPQKLWKDFCLESVTPKGALHIRYKQRELPEPSR
jgi:hypothetical protein